MTQLNNVSFDLLVKAHNGNVGKAKQAWTAICQLGGYGDVPTEYKGGLDVRGITLAREEVDQGEAAFALDNPLELDFMLDNPLTHRPYRIAPPTLDNIKRIEDYASGDTPK